jgi:GT2 family glycosyltransferase
LLNSDVEVSPGWDKGLIEWLDKNNEFAALQPKILSFQNPDFFDYAGAGGGFVDSLGYPYCRGRIFSTIEKDNGQYDDEIEVDWASGACMAIKASVFHEVGGFDSRFFAHMEEIDICWRIRSMGYKIGYFGAVKVWHVGGATLSRANPFKTHLNFRNNLLMLHKNTCKKRFIKIYLFRMILDAIAALSFMLNGNIQDSKEILKAHLAFHKMKYSGNKHVLAKKLPEQISIRRKTSILWDYYIKGWKTFNKN